MAAMSEKRKMRTPSQANEALVMFRFNACVEVLLVTREVVVAGDVSMQNGSRELNGDRPGSVIAVIDFKFVVGSILVELDIPRAVKIMI